MNSVVKRHILRSLALSRGKRRPIDGLAEQFIECHTALM
jgi:hypothetical protein